MMKSEKPEYPDLSSESGPTRNSLISQTKRESVSGQISSRRNSHCSIIQTADHLVLVECKSDPTNIINFNQTNIKDMLTILLLSMMMIKIQIHPAPVPPPPLVLTWTQTLDRWKKHRREYNLHFTIYGS
jgi:hypothetical protein